jgi:hypothetical protein
VGHANYKGQFSKRNLSANLMTIHLTEIVTLLLQVSTLFFFKHWCQPADAKLVHPPAQGAGEQIYIESYVKQK